MSLTCTYLVYRKSAEHGPRHKELAAHVCLSFRVAANVPPCHYKAGSVLAVVVVAMAVLLLVVAVVVLASEAK
jgi:hypothetical protein